MNLSTILSFGFVSIRYEVEIPEDIRPGSTLAWIRATDKDSGLFGTAGIRYTRISGPMAGHLALDSQSGKSEEDPMFILTYLKTDQYI